MPTIDPRQPRPRRRNGEPGTTLLYSIVVCPSPSPAITFVRYCTGPGTVLPGTCSGTQVRYQRYTLLTGTRYLSKLYRYLNPECKGTRPVNSNSTITRYSCNDWMTLEYGSLESKNRKKVNVDTLSYTFSALGHKVVEVDTRVQNLVQYRYWHCTVTSTTTRVPYSTTNCIPQLVPVHTYRPYNTT